MPASPSARQGLGAAADHALVAHPTAVSLILPQAHVATLDGS